MADQNKPTAPKEESPILVTEKKPAAEADPKAEEDKRLEAAHQTRLEAERREKEKPQGTTNVTTSSSSSSGPRRRVVIAPRPEEEESEVALTVEQLGASAKSKVIGLMFHGKKDRTVFVEDVAKALDKLTAAQISELFDLFEFGPAGDPTKLAAILTDLIAKSNEYARNARATNHANSGPMKALMKAKSALPTSTVFSKLLQRKESASRATFVQTQLVDAICSAQWESFEHGDPTAKFVCYRKVFMCWIELGRAIKLLYNRFLCALHMGMVLARYPEATVRIQGGVKYFEVPRQKFPLTGEVEVASGRKQWDFSQDTLNWVLANWGSCYKYAFYGSITRLAITRTVRMARVFRPDQYDIYVEKIAHMMRLQCEVMGTPVEGIAFNPCDSQCPGTQLYYRCLQQMGKSIRMNTETVQRGGANTRLLTTDVVPRYHSGALKIWDDPDADYDADDDGDDANGAFTPVEDKPCPCGGTIPNCPCRTKKTLSSSSSSGPLLPPTTVVTTSTVGTAQQQQHQQQLQQVQQQPVISSSTPAQTVEQLLAQQQQLQPQQFVVLPTPSSAPPSPQQHPQQQQLPLSFVAAASRGAARLPPTPQQRASGGRGKSNRR